MLVPIYKGHINKYIKKIIVNITFTNKIYIQVVEHINIDSNIAAAIIGSIPSKP